MVVVEATPPSSHKRKKQLKLRRLFQHHHHSTAPQQQQSHSIEEDSDDDDDDNDDDERAMLPTESKDTARSLDLDPLVELPPDDDVLPSLTLFTEERSHTEQDAAAAGMNDDNVKKHILHASTNDNHHHPNTNTNTSKISPPRPINPSAKDSRKKDRPIPIRIRKADNNNNKDDPPPSSTNKDDPPPPSTTTTMAATVPATAETDQQQQHSNINNNNSDVQYRDDDDDEDASTVAMQKKKPPIIKRGLLPPLAASGASAVHHLRQQEQPHHDPASPTAPTPVIANTNNQQQQTVTPFANKKTSTTTTDQQQQRQSHQHKTLNPHRNHPQQQQPQQHGAASPTAPTPVIANTNQNQTATPFAKKTSTTTTTTDRHQSHQRQTSQQQQQQDKCHDSSTQNNLSLSLKNALSRPFGRFPKPHDYYVVEVSSAEWDGDDKIWKYRILVQKRQLDDVHQSSFTKAFTFRSVADFFWLEQSLNQEFQGALLVPLLSLLLGSSQQDAPVESDKLKYWLSDILNGVRGGGEWNFPTQLMINDIMKSESMETFLYRHTEGGTIQKEAKRKRHITNDDSNHNENDTAAASGAGSGGCCNTSDDDPSLLNTLLSLASLDLCAGPQSEWKRQQQQGQTASPQRQWPHQGKRGESTKIPLHLLNCSSRALATAPELEIQDSLAADGASTVSSYYVTDSPKESNALSIHSELLFAQKDLALKYKQNADQAMAKLRDLYDEEERFGAAWQRFAKSLLNLFNYEKELETLHLGDAKVKREHIPYRKVEEIDECIERLASEKMDRALPALNNLSRMLDAYLADLNSVGPSVNEYAKNIKSYISGRLPSDDNNASSSGASISSSTSSTTNSNGWEELKEWTMKYKEKLSSPAPEDDESSNQELRERMQLKEFKTRLLTNERLLRESLTTMFHKNPFRLARMAWRYWNTEASQCALTTASASSLLSRVCVVGQGSVSKMLRRHSKAEKVDCVEEMELITKIVNLGNFTKFATDNDTASTTSINNELVEVDNDSLSQGHSQAMSRDRALDMARHRIGRWDAALAMAIMKAVGVDDPNVRVEETTRDLRLIRKYAIGLRETLNECVEAAHALEETITDKRNDKASLETQDVTKENLVRQCRREFAHDISIMFSGTVLEPKDKQPKRSSSSKSVLLHAGIELNDSVGWIPSSLSPMRRKPANTSFSQGRPGDLALQYVKTRDAQVEWLLSSIMGLLNEYYQRVEAIEGFVFMECVGIQLEKHFNAKRSTALSAFEKKADITSAMNVARKKRMRSLVDELQERLDKLGPNGTHTAVKETKEMHLESKQLKTGLHDIAMRRLVRARESSTERVVAIIALWAKEEEINATEEIKVLGEAMASLERCVCKK